MMRIDILRAFVTVAQNGNLKEAAVSLNRTQSALSMALKQLEEHLGGALFLTDRKRDLTDLGEYVRQVATDVIRDHDHGIDLIERYAKGQSGKLRIASVPSVAELLLPISLKEFMLDHEGAQIDLVDIDSVAVRKAVASGRADLGIASADTGSDEFVSELLFIDDLFLVCRSDSPLTHIKAPIIWAQIIDQSMIMNEALGQLKSADFLPLAKQSRLAVRNILSLLAMVKSGAGVTILPGLATVTLPDSLVALPLADPACKRDVCIISRAGRAPSPLSKALGAHLKARIPDLANQYGLKG